MNNAFVSTNNAIVRNKMSELSPISTVCLRSIRKLSHFFLDVVALSVTENQTICPEVKTQVPLVLNSFDPIRFKNIGYGSANETLVIHRACKQQATERDTIELTCVDDSGPSVLWLHKGSTFIIISSVLIASLEV